ncbi:helix-turn-helix transcriptional regulator [Brevibacillus choshinensis]|uniref:helix-turn-helix domain-containing protein n=1 Tax=Brevibacillus choshinensis TaxID=54911 RepID=UPI002E223E27|nr:helix-turn-helix transcriptional regulator [Brevibacillus choshinensis]
MFGLGKKRSRLGRWLDERGIRQSWLAKESEISQETITGLCRDDTKLPSGSTMKKVLQALRKVDPNVKQDDFWTM